jgi:hypothetical protein
VSAQTPPAPASLSQGPGPESEKAVEGSRASEKIAQLANAQAGVSQEGDDAQHYGTLPMLVAGQLVELDLYSVSQKQGSPSDSVRRLILSLSSPGSSPVRVTAEASKGRLKVSVADTAGAAGAAGAASETFEDQVRAVGDLASRLGWQFESVHFVGHTPDTAGESAGLDRLL